MNDITFSKNVYDIDLNEIVPALEKIVNSHSLPNLQISKEEYLERINFAADDLKKVLGHNNEPYRTFLPQCSIIYAYLSSIIQNQKVNP